MTSESVSENTAPRQAIALDTITHSDALAFLKTLPDESVDMVLTSPPYNLANTSGGGLKGAFGSRKSLWNNAKLAHGYSNHDDNMPHEDYVAWQRAVLEQSWRVLSNDGAIFYNHKWRVQNGVLQDRADIVQGLPVRQIIIWHRAGGLNFNDNYFLPTYEVIYLIAKPSFRLAKGASGLGDVWRIPQEADTQHPAPFPLVLAERCIRATSAQVICDPFIGSGTTAIAARNAGRHFVGCDISPEYVAMANKRLSHGFTPDMFATLETASQS